MKGIIGSKKSGVYVDYTDMQAAVLNSLVKAPVINDNAVKKHARDWVRGVSETTPVKTGRARAGWYKGVVGLGLSWSDRGTNYQGWMDKGKEEGRFRKIHNQTRTEYIIENLVPYIDSLDKGTSGQAPAGMTRLATIGMTKKLGKTLVKGYKQAWVRRHTAAKRGHLR
jgi:hypothetical protein